MEITGKYVMGVTGSMGCGKTTFCRRIAAERRKNGMKTMHIDVDELRIEALSQDKETIQKIQEEFGQQMLFANSTINRMALSETIYHDPDAMRKHDNIIMPRLRKRIQESIDDADGLVLLDYALLAEKNLLSFVDAVIIIDCERETQIARLFRGDLPRWQIEKRIAMQHTAQGKERIIRSAGKEVIHM